MIKVEIRDSIIDIINKIVNYTGKSIILEFPFGHLILHNYLSLKILKNKAGIKDLIIITSDLTSKKIGEPLGIKYTIIKNPEFIEEKNILRYNYTFLEYFRFEVKKYSLQIKSFILRNKKLNSIKNYNKNNKGGLGFFILILGISILLLLFIFYFTVNKTYIYITPEIEVKTKSKNLIFKIDNYDTIENTNRIIKLKEVHQSIHLKEKYTTSGIDEKSIIKSKGKAKLINKTNEDIKLVANTRLSTGSGIVFKIIGDSFIPKAKFGTGKNIIPGETIVNITSKIKDINGKIIGDRGNIKSGTFLSIPGLKDPENNIYAISYGNIIGGKSNINKIVGLSDLENARTFLEEKLKRNALNKLKDEIRNNNKTNQKDFTILNINNIIEYSNLDIKEIGDIKVGQKIDNFELEGNIDIKTYIYDKSSVINKLRNTIKDLSLENIENILLIDEKSLRVSNTIYKRSKPFSVKATMEVEVYYSQNFLSKNNAYIERLKGSILGINKQDAKKILINDKKISNIEITTRPFFIKNISNIPDNIIFKIVE